MSDGQTIEQVIGGRIRQRREQFGITQEQLGGVLGEWLEKPWKVQAIYEAEKGVRSFRAVEIVAFARALNTTVGYLMQPDEPVRMPSGATLDPGEAWARMVDEHVQANLSDVLQSLDTLKESIEIASGGVDRAKRALELADQVTSTVAAFAQIAAANTDTLAGRYGDEE